MWKLVVVVPELTGTTVSVVPVDPAAEEDTRDFWAMATGVPSRVVKYWTVWVAGMDMLWMELGI